MAGSAHAELGGSAASVMSEAQWAQANVQITSLASYDVHEMHAPNGATVRQYLDRSGKVFGVAWRTSGPPDLRTVLGAYYARYLALGATRIDLHHAALHSPELVVEVGGVLHAFGGRAYVPAHLPAGLSPSVIR
jgi:hypothetical protein